MKQSENTILITGSGMGIGLLTAELLAKDGNDIIGVDLDSNLIKKTKEVVEASGRKFYGFVCDISNSQDIEKLVKNLKKQKIKFQILINNAGIAPSGSFIEKDFFVWEKTIQINILGLVQLTHSLLPFLISENKSSIINLASIAGKFGSEGTAVYSATKHAVVGFSQALRMEFYDTNLAVSWICPSMVKTRMTEGVKPSIFTPIIEPIQVVNAIRKAILNNPGEVLVPGYLRFSVVHLPALFPKFSLWLAVKTKASKGWLLANKGLEKNIRV
ncbi:MAG: SDR family NAD(P)-dependent oxidoreductase [Leptospira sp.]|nr:SDR family NAD(P)-dependent oxidoreductase [Leptospira sp.]